MDSILKFLKALNRNNNRDWFEKNKPKYLEVKADFEEFVSRLLGEAQLFDASLAGLDPKKLIFRIYRDVRFSKDKRPYKDNLGASFSSAGKGMGTPGYYLQIQPGNKSFVASGLYMPEPENLAKIRQEIDYNGDALLKIMKGKKFKKYFSEFWSEGSLKRMPKGYAEDHPHIKLLKLKSFVVAHEFSDKQVSDKKFIKQVIDSFKAVKPLNDFLVEAIS